MQKIIIAVTNDLVYDQRMIRIAASLQQSGFSVHLVGRKRKQSPPLTPQPFHQKRFSCFFQKGKAFYLEYTLRLWFFLLFQKAELFYAVDLDTLLPCLWVSRWHRRPCLYDAHEYFSHTPEVERRPRIQQFWEYLARYAIPKVQARITVSVSLAQELEQQYGSSFDVVRNMPIKRELLSIEKEKTFTLIYQGALNEGRGLEYLIRVLPELPADIQLWLVGEGDLSADLRELCEHLSLTARVRFWGYQSPNQLSQITPRAHVGCNLLEMRSLSYFFSLANKAFDYVQAGLPALHMDFPEYRHLNREYETSLLLPQLSVCGLKEAVLQLYENRKLYDRLATNCQLAAEEWVWEKEEGRLIDTIKPLLRVSPSGEQE